MHFDLLEARQLLAFAGTFTDVDGDIYKVQLTGNGNAVVTTIDEGATDNNPLTGAIDQLSVTGTDTSSRLRVTVTKGQIGNGRVVLTGLSASVLRSASLAPVNSLPGSALTFADVGQLVFGDVGSGSNVDINASAPGTNLGSRAVAFGAIGSQLTISCGLRAATFTAKSVGNAQFTLPLGVGKVVSTGDARIFFDAGASINEIRVGGFATLRGTINGDALKVSAGAFGPANTNSPLTVTGVLGTLSTKGDLASSFEASRFGSITAGSITGGGLFWTTPDGKGVAIKSVSVKGNVEAGVIAAVGNIGIDGIISSVKIGGLNDSYVSAVAIPSFRCTGTIIDSTVSLSQGTGIASKSFTVTGRIVFTSLLTSNAAGFADFRAQGLEQSTFTGGFISAIALATGDLGGIRGGTSITLRGADSKGFALKTARLGAGLDNSSIIANDDFAGFIGSITGRSIQNTSSLIAPRIKSLVLTGDADGFALRDATIRGIDGTTGLLALGTLDFRGIVTNTNITSAASIDRFSARSIAGGFFMDAGRNQNIGGLAADTGEFFPGNRINRITITKPFAPADSALNGSVAFNAGSIGAITINGLINTTGQSDGGAPFGFAAATFGRITLKNAQGQTVRPTISLVAGNFNPFAPDSAGHFTIRVIA